MKDSFSDAASQSYVLTQEMTAVSSQALNDTVKMAQTGRVQRPAEGADHRSCPLSDQREQHDASRDRAEDRAHRTALPEGFAGTGTLTPLAYVVRRHPGCSWAHREEGSLPESPGGPLSPLPFKAEAGRKEVTVECGEAREAAAGFGDGGRRCRPNPPSVMFHFVFGP